jgi:hypothetical protein
VIECTHPDTERYGDGSCVGPQEDKYPNSTEGLRSLMKGRDWSFALEGGVLFFPSVTTLLEEEVDSSAASSMKSSRRNALGGGDEWVRNG